MADINGFDIDEKGRVLATSGKTPKPFALLFEQPGHAVGRLSLIHISMMLLSKWHDHAFA